MKTYTCDTFTGHWPVPVAAVVRAESPRRASQILNRMLKARGLPGDAKPENMHQFAQSYTHEQAVILSDGNC